MASEASWQTSSAGGGSTAFSTDQPMDQRTVESLLRRLVERVEESERRYGEALDELHARLDQLSQTTEAARETSAPEDSDTFNRLHTQVSKLARRLEQDTSTPLDDFERLGQALTGGLRHDLEESAEPFGHEPEPSPFAQAAMAGKVPAEPVPGAEPEAFPDFSYTAPERVQSKFDTPSAGAEGKEDIFASEHVDLDKRLIEMAERLERSIGTAMPTGAIEALNTRLDEIGSQLAQTLEKAPTRDALEHVERQISDMSQQFNRAEEQLGKIGGIEAHLLKMIERLDEKPAPVETAPAQLEEIVNKAAAEAANRVAAEAKQSSDRLDAMHRDLNAMSDKNRESSDRLVSTLEAVHESLKQLVQQVERGAPALQQRARAPFLDRGRQGEAKQAAPQAKPVMPSMAKAAEQPMARPAAPAQAKSSEEAPARERTLRDRLGAAIPDFKESEAPPPFGRAKRPVPGEEAVDLDATPQPRNGEAAAPNARARISPELDNEHTTPDDLVAAARRAAQAAAMRAEERGGRRSSKLLPGSAPTGEQPTRSRRSVLIIAAAVLLICSAILLYGRLATKPATETAPAATEESAPVPSAATDGAASPESEGTSPASDPEKSGWAPLPGPAPEDVGQTTTGITDIAKSSNRVPPMPASELSAAPQLASLKPNGAAALPPGVVFSIEEPAETGAKDATNGLAVPAALPLPPESLGSLALRQAASKGEPEAQYAIAVRYAEGNGTKRDLEEAARWFERAASAGLAPAQYRLAAMYERGLGVDKDLGQAQSWYAAAAEKGNVKAMHNLAVSVSGRDGSTPDYALAAKWYREAAAHGLADSQFNLGILAEHGLGMKKDQAEAYKWFSLAAAQGDSEAAKRREVVRVQLSPETLAEADAALKAWKAKDSVAEANEVADNPAWADKPPATNNASLVTRAQTLLNALGYDVGAPDGLVGERTRQAIKRFQQRNGLDETGEVSIPLVTQLEHLTS